MELRVADVIFNKEFYTRSESQSPSKVQEYAKSIAGGEFPPILLNQDNNLLDGWHRWMAHKECKLETIIADVLDTTGMDVFTIRRKAARFNFRHGQPQTENELKKLIRDEYRGKLDNLDQKGRAELKQEMATDYSRSIEYVRGVTSRIDKDLKVELRETAFNMWMACYSQQEIADHIGYSKQAVSEFFNLLQLSINGTDAENGQSSKNPALEFDEEPEEDSNSLGVYVLDKRLLIKADHMDEHFKPPIYNVWKQQTRSNQTEHYGNSEITWLDNLLYLYTRPFDIVVDPFAGGGSTIDLCKKRIRRYLVSDRKPIDIRSDIRIHDIKDGVLSPSTWKDVKLVFLDPPYWKQAEGKYSQDAEDLANMELEQFTEALAGVVKGYAEKLKRARTENAFIALIISPTQYPAPNKEFTDHVGDMLRAVKLPVDMRYSVPYESQQYNGNMVNWAKENKKCLVLTREIIVWRIV
jgi:hypothetical protein